MPRVTALVSQSVAEQIRKSYSAANALNLLITNNV